MITLQTLTWDSIPRRLLAGRGKVLTLWTIRLQCPHRQPVRGSVCHKCASSQSERVFIINTLITPTIVDVTTVYNSKDITFLKKLAVSHIIILTAASRV